MVLKDCLNNLIQDYLNKGKQYTVASITKLTLGNTTYGIPHWSTLVPLLFSMYGIQRIGQLPPCLKQIFLHLTIISHLLIKTLNFKKK